MWLFKKQKQKKPKKQMLETDRLLTNLWIN